MRLGEFLNLQSNPNELYKNMRHIIYFNSEEEDEQAQEFRDSNPNDNSFVMCVTSNKIRYWVVPQEVYDNFKNNNIKFNELPPERYQEVLG